MATAANSYGSAAEVGKLTPRWTSGGTFTTGTAPLLATVETWIDQVSGLMNTILASYGFSIPVTDADAVSMLAMFVEAEVAAMVEGVHGSGRFGPTATAKGGGDRFAIIRGDVSKFVEDHAVGMERLGATRSQSSLTGLGYRDTDQSGTETHPLFQREQFGNTYENSDA